MSKTQDILERARELVAKGWVQGASHYRTARWHTEAYEWNVKIRHQDKKVQDCYCASGALRVASLSLSPASPNRSHNAALNVLADAGRYGAGGPPSPHRVRKENDDPETTHENVLQWFDRAIERAA